MSTYEIIQKLCKERKIAITALEKKLGFGRGSIGKMKNGSTSAERLQKIADYFEVSIEYLTTGKESFDKKEQQLTIRDERDIAKRLERTLADLENPQEALMFSGEPLNDETKELLKASLENSIRIAKINAKKFTPDKYKNNSE